jgi:ubiquitin carboxyl-terminal hydrolase 48
MQRKKSKHSISFPTTLDMTRFLGSAADRKSASTKQSDENIYELRGVLLHKGKSAYHGHYEAQVFDATYVFIFLAVLLSTHSPPANTHGFNSMTKP